MRINLNKGAAVFYLVAFLTLQTGCAGLTKTPLPSLNNPEFRKQLAGSMHHGGGPSALWAGMASRDITPPVGTPLSGYGRRKGRPSQGVHDLLHVRVLALKNQTDKLVFASCDLVAISQELYQAVFERLEAQSALEKSQLFLSATHTHSGSGGIGKRFLERIISGRYQKKVFQLTADSIAGAVLEALRDMKPASIGFGSARLEGMIENRMIENERVDDELSIIKIQIRQGPQALLVNMAAHPTVLSAKNYLFSADFPGVLQKTVEERFPGAVCVFTNAAAGDQRIHGFNDTEGYARAEAIGNHLAEIVIKTAESISLKLQAEIATLQAPIRLPPVKIRYGFLRPPSLIGNRLIDRNVVCNAARVNETFFISIPGEMTSELGFEIKREARNLMLNPVIVGYANGFIGYIIPEKYYKLKIYESSVTFFGPALDRYFLEAARAQMQFMKEAEYEAAA